MRRAGNRGDKKDEGEERERQLVMGETDTEGKMQEEREELGRKLWIFYMKNSFTSAGKPATATPGTPQCPFRLSHHAPPGLLGCLSDSLLQKGMTAWGTMVSDGRNYKAYW